MPRLSRAFDCKEHRLFRQWAEPCSSSYSQWEITHEAHRIILLRFLSSMTFKITSSFHIREYALYVCEQIDTVSVPTSRGLQQYPRCYLELQRREFNPHVTESFRFCDYARYRTVGSQVHHYPVLAFGTVLRRASVDRWGGCLRSISLKYHFHSHAGSNRFRSDRRSYDAQDRVWEIMIWVTTQVQKLLLKQIHWMYYGNWCNNQN